MIRCIAAICSVAFVAISVPVSAQEAEYSVDDIVGTFGCDPPDIEGADGECREQATSDTRSFSLVRPPSPPARKPPKKRDLSITFASNSARLTPQAQANARVFADALNGSRLSRARFAIDGHTDAVGSAAYNMDLSRRRAQALADQLAADGVDRRRLQVRGYGHEQPVDPNNPKSPINRRVEARRLN